MAKAKIGIITNDPNAVFQHAVIDGFRQQVGDQYGITVLPYDKHTNQPAIEAIANEVDGVLVIADCVKDSALRAIHQNGKSVSLISHQSPDVPAVMANNAQGIGALVKYLVKDCGRRKLLFVRGLTDQIDAKEREHAFRREAVRYNLALKELHFLRGEFDPQIAANSMRDLLKSGVAFDGVVVSDYVMAIAVIEVLREAGIRVPEDVSVVGFGDDPVAEAAGLTTVSANIVELGRCAGRQLIQQIDGMHISGVTLISVELVVRGT